MTGAFHMGQPRASKQTNESKPEVSICGLCGQKTSVYVLTRFTLRFSSFTWGRGSRQSPCLTSGAGGRGRGGGVRGDPDSHSHLCLGEGDWGHSCLRSVTAIMKLRCLYSAPVIHVDRNKIDLSGLPRIRLADVHAGYSSSEADTNKCSWVRPFCRSGLCSVVLFICASRLNKT